MTRHFDGTPHQEFERRIPSGDTHQRDICQRCDLILYDNPKVVVGAVPVWEGRVLLCIRAIEPRKGTWTFPSGFLEHGESTQEGAAREAREEACVELKIGPLLGLYSVARRGQVHLVYAAEMLSPEFAAGEESQEVRLFDPEEIPWEELAFPTIHAGLEHWLQAREALSKGDMILPKDLPPSGRA